MSPGQGGVRLLATRARCRHPLPRAAANETETLYGHDHVFVDDVVDGIHYTLPGSCGAPWKFGRDVTGYARHWPDSGHAVLDVRPDHATVQFVGLAGQVIHQFGVEAR